MASQANVYQNTSQYFSSYSPRPDSSNEDYKPHYEYDIIDSYATAEIPLPRQPKQTYPSNPTFLKPDSQPRYPPQASKTSLHGAWTSTSDLESSTYDGGGGGGSTGRIMPVVDEKQESRSFWKTVLPDSIACRLYVLTVLIETCIDITIEADLLFRVRDLTQNTDQDFSMERLQVYLVIFALAHLFQLVMAVDAVHARNTLQFMFLTVFNALFLIYAAIQITEIRLSIPTKDSGGDIPVNVLTVTIPIVISVAEVAYIALGWKIWREFGWKLYKRLGADRQIKRMYAKYQIFVCIMKFDVFFFIGFSYQLIMLVLDKHDWEWYLTCAALPFSFLLLVDGMLAARYENRYMMVTFMLGCVGAMVYFVYKLFRIVHDQESNKEAVKTLAVFAIIAIALLVVTFVLSIIVLRNFGGGLKYHMTKPKSTGQTFKSQRDNQRQSYPLGFNPNRMSID